MSYIIAFVKYSLTGSSFPVNCLRTDVSRGDIVYVKNRKGELKEAEVTKIEYLDWNCNSFILCTQDDIKTEDLNKLSTSGRCKTVGLVNIYTMSDYLLSIGWDRVYRPNRVHRVLHYYSNNQETAGIWLSTHGVNLQILDNCTKEQIINSGYNCGRMTVRHYLSQTSFNLYEGISRFAQSFSECSGNYDRFFKSVGSKDKRNAYLISVLKKKKEEEEKLRQKRDDNWDYETWATEEFGLGHWDESSRDEFLYGRD